MWTRSRSDPRQPEQLGELNPRDDSPVIISISPRPSGTTRTSKIRSPVMGRRLRSTAVTRSKMRVTARGLGSVASLREDGPCYPPLTVPADEINLANA